MTEFCGKLPCFECPARMSDLCVGLPDNKLQVLFEKSTHLELPKGETLFLDDQEAQHIYNIRDGAMTMFRIGPAGQRQVLEFLFTGDLFGITPSNTYGFSIEASVDTKLCRWDRDKFEDLLLLFPAMGKQFHLIASKALAQSMDLVFALGRFTAEQRLAAFLVHLQSRQTENEHNLPHISLNMSRSDIADYLGLTVETVSRSLTKLKSKGFITLPSTDKVVIDNQTVMDSLALGGD